MPLVAAGLPVLQALDVRERRAAAPAGSRPFSANSAGSSVSAVFSNCCSREVSRSLTASAASLGGAAEERLQHQDAVGELALLLDLALVGEQVVAQVHAVGEGVLAAPASAGVAATGRGPRRRRRAPRGPPTRARRRPCGASRCTRSGSATRSALMLDSSHSRLVEQVAWCSSTNRAPPVHRTWLGTVRAHRSARPASTGLVGSGGAPRQVHRHERAAAGRGTPCRPRGPGCACRARGSGRRSRRPRRTSR